MTDRQRIVLDCDPGIDDAFAIFCALRYCDLAAITSVSGNVTIDDTTRNARHVLDLAGATHVPVHRGAARPLEVEPGFATYVHGPSGLGSERTPEPATAEDPMPAVDALIAHAAQEQLTIVATGPLTNLAQAIQTEPSFVNRVREIRWMGGSTGRGNVTELAEFNAWADPDAADIVLRSGIPITMYGLNLTHQVRMSSPHAEVLEQAGTPSAKAAATYLRYYEQHGAGDGAGQPMHDPCAVLGASHRGIWHEVSSRIVVGTSDDETRGRTQVLEETAGSGSPVTVAERIDTETAVALIIDAAREPAPA